MRSKAVAERGAEADLTGPILREKLGAEYEELRDRRVLIDAPVGYC